ncbi:MAG: site-2 protease family protein [Patescibacteria group bacterium]
MLFSLIKSPLDFTGFIIGIILSLTLHAYAQAWMAARLGDHTARFAGRMSLNPSRHFDPTGTVFLVLFGFGWSKPIPINISALSHKYDRAKIALAGIAAQILLAVVVAIPFSIARGFFGLGSDSNVILYIFNIIFQITLWMTAINLLPIPPLDGATIIRSLAPASWEESVNQFEKYGPLVLLGAVLFEILLNIPVLSPLLFAVTRFLEFLVMYPITVVIKSIVLLFS